MCSIDVLRLNRVIAVSIDSGICIYYLLHCFWIWFWYFMIWSALILMTLLALWSVDRYHIWLWIREWGLPRMPRNVWGSNRLINVVILCTFSNREHMFLLILLDKLLFIDCFLVFLRFDFIFLLMSDYVYVQCSFLWLSRLARLRGGLLIGAQLF